MLKLPSCRLFNTVDVNVGDNLRSRWFSCSQFKHIFWSEGTTLHYHQRYSNRDPPIFIILSAPIIKVYWGKLAQWSNSIVLVVPLVFFIQCTSIHTILYLYNFVSMSYRVWVAIYFARWCVEKLHIGCCDSLTMTHFGKLWESPWFYPCWHVFLVG